MYKVGWRDVALDRLADVFVAADPAVRDRIERAVAGLNTRLAADPFAEGESRDRGQRIAFIDQLVVHFEVDAAAGTVRVYYAARYGR